MTAKLAVTIPAWEDGQSIPDRFAFCKLGSPTEMGENISPEIRWDDAPSDTKSFAVILTDVDGPTSGDDVNQQGREVPADLPRGPFVHWVLIDLPASTTSIDEGAASSGITKGGKAVGPLLGGITGANDYTGWLASDPEMAGTYGSYDGPCPPWNDAAIHHYNFEVFALDVGSLGISGDALNAPAAHAAMEGHILASGSYVGTYTLNKRLV